MDAFDRFFSWGLGDRRVTSFELGEDQRTFNALRLLDRELFAYKLLQFVFGLPEMLARAYRQCLFRSRPLHQGN